MGIKLVSFDFWGTLYHNEPSLLVKQRDTIIEFLNREGIDNISVSGVDDAVHLAWRAWDSVWKEQYFTMGVNPWLDDVLDRLNLNLSGSSLSACCTALQALLFSGNTKEISGVRAILEILRKDYRLSIISDTGIESGSYLKELLKREKLDLFDYYIFSDEHERSKPHISLFKDLLSYFHLIPEEVVHIGDSRRTDVFGARSAGMGTIRFSGCKNDMDEKYAEADYVIDNYTLLPGILKKV